jgi:methylated-DNA-protein-cysteine methyltransferase related protein
MPGKKRVTKKAGKTLPAGGPDQNFFEQVFAVARLIPRGRVTTYGAIAAALGARSSSRAVGYAMNSSHVTAEKIPAHRVVNRMGILSGKHHFGEPDRMENLLKKEGVEVKDDRVVDFNRLFWDPAVELDRL